MSWLNAVVQGVLLGGFFAISALGLSIVFGVMRIVNLAHGALMILAAYGSVLLIERTGLGTWSSLLVVVPVMAALGYLLQRLVLQRAVSISELAPLMVTFGISIMIPNALVELFTSDVQALPTGNLATRSVSAGGIAVGLLPLLTFGIAVVLIAGLQLFLARARSGRLMRAAADDSQALRLMGVDNRVVYAQATAIAFATLALAGVLFGVRQGGVAPFDGQVTVLLAFETVIIGGLGSLWGTLVGGIVLGVTQTLGGEFSPEVPLLVGNLMFLAVLAFRPNGILGRETRA
ncbi:MAG: branched-chain amino acid ABC transporter permease [Actinobacteria bacterium]|nr:branched-chain amino acid ABC transporter permease [Actinomycetota bacterium]MBI3686710.1 branched-chain amino acid ABC transporter permease [Actinomycetota bacterium]